MGSSRSDAERESPVVAPLSLSLPVDPSALASARRALSAWLQQAGVALGDVEDVLIAANEACMNAVEHSGSPRESEIEFSGSLEGPCLELQVLDGGSWRHGEPREDRGHGLGLMDKLMDTVEIERGESGSGTKVLMKKELELGVPTASPGPGELVVEVSETAGAAVVAVAGEIDLASVPQVERQIVRAAPATGKLVLDFAAVSYLDSSGVHMLFRLARRSRERSAPFGVVAPDGAVRRVLELTGADTVFPLERTIEGALTRLAAARD